mmetsp:Transcript_9977/g.14383  ORF Transcript_9977/g.14383 Transcript_9977/m.14383 type:complete len:113 (+) Transcript_9977:366-704(+)
MRLLSCDCSCSTPRGVASGDGGFEGGDGGAKGGDVKWATLDVALAWCFKCESRESEARFNHTDSRESVNVLTALSLGTSSSLCRVLPSMSASAWAWVVRCSSSCAASSGTTT